MVADALIGAYGVHHDCDQPGNAEVMAGITSRGGNVLENLAAAGAVPPEFVLPAGLALLSVLAERTTVPAQRHARSHRPANDPTTPDLAPTVTFARS